MHLCRSRPAKCLRRVCDFLDIEYEEGMVVLKAGTEDLGDAKGKAGIVKNNYGKWKTALSKGSAAKIEKICASVLRDLNYPLTHTGKDKRLGKVEMQVYGLMDKVNWLLFEIKRHSFRQGILNVFRDRRMERAV